MLPYETVLEMWRRCIAAAYAPEAVYARFAHNIAHTFSRRKNIPRTPQRASWANVRMGLGILARLIWRIGVRSDYRRTFWQMAWPALKAGEIEPLIHVGDRQPPPHRVHARLPCRALGEASFYAPAPSRGHAPSRAPRLARA